MSVNLQKGQKISLSKDNESLSQIMVGLGWDPVSNNGGGGLLRGLFGGGGQGKSFDCDASVVLLNENNKLCKDGLIYYGNLRNSNDSIIHQGDNLTGSGDGDDEQIMINLSQVPQNVHKLMFIVNIYNCVARKQDFGMIKNAFIRVVDMNKRTEMLKYRLNEQYEGKTALFVGEIYRNNGEWKFGAVGEGTNDTSIKEMLQRY